MRLSASTTALVLHVAKLQMLSIGGVRMTPAGAHEQVTNCLARQGLKAELLLSRGCVLDARVKRFVQKEEKVWYRV